MLYILLLIVSILGLAYVNPTQGQILDNATITNYYQEEKPAQQANANTPLLPSATVAASQEQQQEEEPHAYELKNMHGGPLKYKFNPNTDDYHHYPTFLTQHKDHLGKTSTTSSSFCLAANRDKILFVILTIGTIIVWGILAFQLLGFRSISAAAMARHSRQFYSPLSGEV